MVNDDSVQARRFVPTGGKTMCKRTYIRMSLIVSLFLSADLGRAQVSPFENIRFPNELARITAQGLSDSLAAPVAVANSLPPASTSSSALYRGYKFTPILDDGYFPSINNLGEIVYEKFDARGNPNVFSNRRGWMTFSTSGAARGPDINDAGEIVFCDNASQTPGGGPFTVWSTVRGRIDDGCWPSINDNGEIVYERTQFLPRTLKSITRGVVATLSTEETSPLPEVNDYGEVVYEDRVGSMQQIFSTQRGQITFLPSGAGGPTINNSGEIIYTAWDETNVQQLFSTVHGRLTDASLFGYPQAPRWTGTEPFGLYFLGSGFGADLNDQGQIVFSLVLAEGPYCDTRGCFGVARIKLYQATPVIPVTLDIKPGDYPNAINPRNGGVVSTAILTTSVFDAATVDVATVRFGRTGTETGPLRFALDDVNGDGRLDLLLHFRTQETGIRCGDTSATVSGETFSGRPILGTDTVVTVGCK